jgi:uncharacterized protein YjbI with pentapeptide repeats
MWWSSAAIGPLASRFHHTKNSGFPDPRCEMDENILGTLIMSPSGFMTMISRQKSGASGSAVENAKLTQEHFGGGDLDGTSIALSSLVSVLFDARSSLQGVSWIGNQLQGVRFEEVPLNKAELLDCELVLCSFANCAFKRIDLTGTVFRSCRFERVDFSSACLINVHFIDCDFSEAVFPDGLMVEGKNSVHFGPDGRVGANG